MNECTRRVNVQRTFNEENRWRVGGLSPLLSNIMLDQLDKYHEVYLFLRDKLELKINREKSGIRRPSNFKVLGHCFTSVYKKGSKGQYQLIVSKSSWANLKRKLKRATKKTLGLYPKGRGPVDL